MYELSKLFVTPFKNIKYLKMKRRYKDNWKKYHPLYKVSISRCTITFSLINKVCSKQKQKQLLNLLKKTTISIIDQYVSLGCYKNVENLEEKIRGVIYSFA